MGMLYTIRPDDLEPVEFTHFDCWDDETTMEEIINSWSASLGITLPIDSWDSAIMQLLRKGFDVYEGEEFIEIFEGLHDEDI
jgi:hypothetical protein